MDKLRELLKTICGIWERQIELCKKTKHSQFGETADELWKFLGKSYRDLYDPKHQDKRFTNREDPFYKARISKSAEAVALFVPYVLNQVPHRMVTPRRPPIPMELQGALSEAELAARQALDAQDEFAAYEMQWWLNYTQSEFNLKREARTALPEAFVKGRGVLWHEMVEAPAGLIPASLFVSVDNLGIDSDAQQLWDAGFVYRKRRRSVWWLSKEFGIPRERLRAVAKSALQEGGEAANDVCDYYEVYTRMGVGHWIDTNEEAFKDLGAALDELGQHCYLVIMPGMDHPLNLNPGVLSGEESVEELKQRLQWPIPFYADMAGNPWPFSPLDFYPHQKDPWSDSPLQPGLPMQIFLDHLYSFMMNRIRVSTSNLAVASQALEAQLQQDLVKHFDMQWVFVPGKPGIDLKEMLAFAEFPELNPDLWKVLPLVERAYERATGLEPLLYGAESDRQIRTATESQMREAHASKRPDDYADATEDWLSAAAAKEGLAARLSIEGATVAPLFGETAADPDDPGTVSGPLTTAWENQVRTEDPYLAASEFSISIEAGSARKKNKQKQAADFQQIAQTLGQPLIELAMAGVPEPFNALAEMMGETLDVPVDRLMIPPGLKLAGPEAKKEEQKAKEKSK